MFRILSLSLVLIGIVYFLPVMTGEKQLEEITLPEINIESVADFSISDIKYFDSEEKIAVLLGDEIVNLEIDDYLVGVVSAEMPATFENEALKAQAVAARTYIYYKQELINQNLSDGVHDGALVCDDPTHCKAYIDIENNNPWGDKYDEYKEKITQSVDNTSGEIVVFEEQPIAAVFHSTSSQSTESAEDVWGSAIPYLVSVESVGSESSPKYQEQKSISFDNFKQIILNNNSDAIFDENPQTWFQYSTRSDAGGILEVYVGGICLKGTELREMFSLNSTNFTVDYDDENVIFTTTGYGHGVGMSQYGANELAKQGMDYKDILTWYYTDTEIIQK